MELLTRAFSPVMMAMSDQSLLACQSSFGNQARAVGGLGVHFVSKRAIVHSSAHDSPIASTIYYNVKKGDTLTSIARRHKTSVRSIAEVNDIVDINILQEGQVLLIPLNQRVLQRMTSVIEGFEESSTLKFTSRRLPSKAITLKSQTKDSNTILPATAFPPNTLSNFVKTVAPIFLLVPIVGVCISYFVYGIYCKLTLDVSKQQADREVQDVQHTPKLKRWQMILDDDKETEELGFMHDIENQMVVTDNASHCRGMGDLLMAEYPRFAYQFIMLERLHRLKGDLQHMATSNEFTAMDLSQTPEGLAFHDILFMEPFWFDTQQLRDVMRAMYFVMRHVDCERCTRGLIYEFMDRIGSN